MNKFWKKVYNCEHKNLSPVYHSSFGCWTPYCSGYESYCLDCLVYISQCGCGSENGMSGWPRDRRRRQELRKELKNENYACENKKNNG